MHVQRSQMTAIYATEYLYSGNDKNIWIQFAFTMLGTVHVYNCHQHRWRWVHSIFNVENDNVEWIRCKYTNMVDKWYITSQSESRPDSRCTAATCWHRRDELDQKRKNSWQGQGKRWKRVLRSHGFDARLNKHLFPSISSKPNGYW